MPNTNYPQPKPIKFFAHRGHCTNLPENSFEAFNSAFKLGARAIELDVHLVEDKLIVFHDTTVDRMTTHSGELTDFPLKALLNMPLNKQQKITISTLGNVFAQFAGDLVINIELKGPNTARPTVELINQYCEENCQPSDFLISSFDHQQLKQVRSLSKTIPIGILTRGLTPEDHTLAHQLQAHSYHINIQRLTDEFIKSAHNENFKIYTYPVDDISTIQQAKKLNADAIFIKDTILALSNWL